MDAQIAKLNTDILAGVELDPRMLMAAKAIQIMGGTNDDGTPKISTDMAIAAALYQAGTGQLVGRDFYVNDKVGRMEGYRGAARDAANRGAGELQIDYRPLRPDENEENEVKPGDTAYICEVYQLRAWRMAQKMGQPYKPIIGIGIVRETEKYTDTDKWAQNNKGKWYKAGLKPREEWKPIQLEGGMTWAKKAKNRAYKDALRHVPGAPISAAEILEEGALDGVPLPPEGARLTVEQAEKWVEQEGRTEAVVAEYRALTPEEQSARFQANVNAMRGDPNADPFQDAPPPPGVTPEQDFADMPSATEEHAAQQAERDGFVPTCPVCNSEMWDNREGKRNPQAPDFKCKDKQCPGDGGKNKPYAIWLPETPEKGRSAMFANVKAVYGEGEAQQAEFKTWMQERYHVTSSKELTLTQLADAIARLKQQQPA